MKKCRLCKENFNTDAHHFHICQKEHYFLCKKCGKEQIITSPVHQIKSYDNILEIIKKNDKILLKLKEECLCDSCKDLHECDICNDLFSRKEFNRTVKSNICGKNHFYYCNTCGNKTFLKSIGLDKHRIKSIIYKDDKEVIIDINKKCPECSKLKPINCMVCNDEFIPKQNYIHICDKYHYIEFDGKTQEINKISQIGGKYNILYTKETEKGILIELKNYSIINGKECRICKDGFYAKNNRSFCYKKHYLKCNKCGNLILIDNIKQLENNGKDFDNTFNTLENNEHQMIFEYIDPTPFDICDECKKDPLVHSELMKIKGERISKTHHNNIENGYRPNLLKVGTPGSYKKFWVLKDSEEHYLKSSWEFIFAIFLSFSSKDWKYESIQLEYKHNGKKHFYYPDFICDDIIYEIKGLKDESILGKKRNVSVNNGYKFKLLERDQISKIKEYIEDKYLVDLNVLIEEFSVKRNYKPIFDFDNLTSNFNDRKYKLEKRKLKYLERRCNKCGDIFKVDNPKNTTQKTCQKCKEKLHKENYAYYKNSEGKQKQILNSNNDKIINCPVCRQEGVKTNCTKKLCHRNHILICDSCGDKLETNAINSYRDYLTKEIWVNNVNIVDEENVEIHVSKCNKCFRSKKCKKCGKDFTPKNRDTETCDDCRNKKKTPEHNTCILCGNEFKVSGKGAWQKKICETKHYYICEKTNGKIYLTNSDFKSGNYFHYHVLDKKDLTYKTIKDNNGEVLVGFSYNKEGLCGKCKEHCKLDLFN